MPDEVRKVQTEKLTSIMQQNAPCYIYDKGMITARCRELQNAMPGDQLLYSIKTNPFMLVVKPIAAEHYGADAASAEEVLCASQA